MHFPIAALAEGGGGFNPLDLSGIGGYFWTVVIFAVALPFMWKVVMGPIARALEERDDHARRAITAAERASSEAERARAEVEVKLGEARAEAAQLLAEARARAEVREREMIESAKNEARTLLETARTSIRAEQEKALAAIRGEVVELSLNAASRVLGRNVGSEDDRRLVSELVGSAATTRGDGST